MMGGTKRRWRIIKEMFTVTFSPELTEEQIISTMTALANYYRACGGVGFEVEWLEEELVRAREKCYIVCAETKILPLSAPNSADNIKIAEATEFLSKLSKLGLYAGPLCINEAFSSQQANYVPVANYASLDGETAYNCVVHTGRDWRNVAKMKLAFGEGGMVGFSRLYEESSQGPHNASTAILNIPGVGKAVNKIIDAA